MFARHALTVALLLLIPSIAMADEASRLRLSFTQGSVQVSSPDSTDWSEAQLNLPVSAGDRLWLPEDSRAELQAEGGVYIRADEKTTLDVLSLDRDSMQLYIDHGHVYVNNLRGGIQIVQIDTPQSSVRIYDNSIITLDLGEDGLCEIQALKGYAYAENREGKTRITAGNVLTIRPDAATELAPVGAPDEWENWNVERDRQELAWGESSRYLPESLHEYSSDFDAGGRWVYVTEYGYVWNPVVDSAVWAPYREGRWRWWHGRYVWIANEPWGWAPHHYGRWVYAIGSGWCWVPPAGDDIFWSPGYVAWVDTPEYVGWVPLAPGEIYYGYGYYGPHSVNIVQINVQTIVVQNHVNVSAPNSVTVVARNAFGTMNRMLMKLHDNPFTVMKNPFPPPAHGPAAGTVVRDQRAQTSRRPPDGMTKIRQDEMRLQRRIVKDRDASVFYRETPKPLMPKQMKEPRAIIRKPKPVEKHDKKDGMTRREQNQSGRTQ